MGIEVDEHVGNPGAHLVVEGHDLEDVLVHGQGAGKVALVAQTSRFGSGFTQCRRHAL
jgi:hypothetical protein